MRGRYEGIWNVVRFNWPTYALGVLVLVSTITAAAFTTTSASIFFVVLSVLACLALVTPLIASHIIYDRSDLYDLTWLRGLPDHWTGSILNLNAGFDETSRLIRGKLPYCDLYVGDFYDPERHTEASIARARKAYTTFPGTLAVDTDLLPYQDKSMDIVHAFFSVHEVRDQQERIRVLSSINRILKPTGRLVITEHLRDLPNFLAFNLGFLHFHSRTSWLRAFQHAGLEVHTTKRTTAFVTTYTLHPR